jgi:hypothetical protein
MGCRFSLVEVGGGISTLDHRPKPSSFSNVEAHRRMLFQPPPRASPWKPRLMAVGAILATGIALAATLVLSAQRTSAQGSRPAGRAASRHNHPRVDPTRFEAQALRRGRHVERYVGESPLDTLPFAPNPADRATRRGEVPSLYADGSPCSTGCRPYGAEIGWPLVPFHQQHPIRAGLNELRPGSLHVGVDIQARDGAAVYAVQPGVARVLAPSGPNARVQVGNYVYWHITPTVRTGELVIPFKTVLGAVMAGYGHIAFSEIDAPGTYVNPLRPGGSVLEPHVDRTRPVIGAPSVAANGQVIVPAYSPQTFVRRTTYVTPVLAPAAIAYRLYDSHGSAITPLEWGFRGTHLLPYWERSLIYVPRSHAPGYACFATRSVCVPNWVYRVAGGLAPPLPTAAAPGRYRVTIYAWDWGDNETALDTTVTMTPTGWRPIGRFPTILLHVPGYSTQSKLLPPVRGGGAGGSPAPAGRGSYPAPSYPGPSYPSPTYPAPAPASPAPRAASPGSPGGPPSHSAPPSQSGGSVVVPTSPTPPAASPAPSASQPNSGAASPFGR